MSLLKEIQAAAADTKIDLPSLLRKCKILAARLGNNEFKQWVDDELNGYKEKEIEQLPNYRIIEVDSQGNFLGPGGAQFQNYPIALSFLPEDVREILGHAYLRQAAASLQSLVSTSDGRPANEFWNPSMVSYMNSHCSVIRNFRCMQAWKVIPITEVVAAIDAIRTRILSFVLEIEAEVPGTGEIPANNMPAEKVQHIFNNIIMGNVHNFAQSSHDFEQVSSGNSANADVFNRLLDAVRNLENTEDVAKAADIIEKMKSTQRTSNYRMHYFNFMSVLADHAQILGPLVGPYLPALSNALGPLKDDALAIALYR